MDLIDFTSFDDIRAALGVSPDEISDDTISLDLYKNRLIQDLEAIDLDLVATFEALQDTPADARTAAQGRFTRAMQTFATYAVARQLTGSLPLFAPKEISDGKAAIGRWAQDPFKAVIASVKESYEAARVALEEALGGLTSSPAPTVRRMTIMAVASPSYDPITG